MNREQQAELSRMFSRVLGSSLEYEMIIEEKATVLPSQKTIDFGTTWMRLIHGEQGCPWEHNCRHIHWGRVLTVREYALGRLEAGDTPEEIEDHIEELRMRHARGWRLSEIHCDACALASLESIPIAGIWPVEPGEYSLARQAGFFGNAFRDEGWYWKMRQRYTHQTLQEARIAGLVSRDPIFEKIEEGGES